MLVILSTPLLSSLKETGSFDTIENFSKFLQNVAAQSELELSVETINVLIYEANTVKFDE